MKTEFYVIKLGDYSYWVRDVGSRHLISGSIGSPLKATHIEPECAHKILPELKKICPEASIMKVNATYTEEACA